MHSHCVSRKATEIEELKRKVEEELQKTKSVLSDVTKNSLKKSEFEEVRHNHSYSEWFCVSESQKKGTSLCDLSGVVCRSDGTRLLSCLLLIVYRNVCSGLLLF